MPSWTEVHAELERRSKERPSAPQALLDAHVQGSHMVALKLEELLKGDDWNTFVAHLKAFQALDEAERDTLRSQIEAGGSAPEELYRATSRLQRVLGRLERGEQALNLPKEILARDQALQTAYEKTLDMAPPESVPNGT